MWLYHSVQSIDIEMCCGGKGLGQLAASTNPPPPSSSSRNPLNHIIPSDGSDGLVRVIPLRWKPILNDF
jgi:hypothetical protein